MSPLKVPESNNAQMLPTYKNVGNGNGQHVHVSQQLSNRLLSDVVSSQSIARSTHSPPDIFCVGAQALWSPLKQLLDHSRFYYVLNPSNAANDKHPCVFVKST